jgi:hypothetical protein
MATRDPQANFGGADSSAGRGDAQALASVLADLGGQSAAVARQSASLTLQRGEVREVTRDSDAALIAVEEGFILVSSHTCYRDGNGGSASRRIVVATGQPGTLLLPPGPSERLEALTTCRITIVSTDSLESLLELPSGAQAIANAFAEGLREHRATIRNCTHVHHRERVFGKLLQLAGVFGRAVPGGVRVDFPLTQQLLADMVGSARETVSLALSDLARDGLLLRQHGRYVLKIEPHELFSSVWPSDLGVREDAHSP